MKDPAIALSTELKSDMISALLFVVVSLGLVCQFSLDSPAWYREMVVRVWYEFVTLVFFMRPVFHLPEFPIPWLSFIVGLARSLGVFFLATSLTFLLVRSGELPEFPQWLVIPALLGCGAYTLGVILRKASRQLGD